MKKLFSFFSRTFLGLTLVGVMGLLPGCNGDTPPPDNGVLTDVQEVINEGRSYLWKGDYYNAQDRFYKAVEDYEEAITPEEHAEALYGYVLAESLLALNEFTAEMEKMMTSVGNLLESTGSGIFPSQTDFDFSVDVLVNDLIYGMLLREADLLRRFIAEINTITDDVGNPITPTFCIDDPATEDVVEGIPIYLGAENQFLWVVITGELDRGDLDIFDSLFAVAQAIGEIILSIHWEVNLNALINSGLDVILAIVSQIPIPVIPNYLYMVGPEDLEVPLIPAISSVLAYTLNRSPVFLKLDYTDTLPAGGGPALLVDAADKLSGGSQGFLDAFSWIQSEPIRENGPISIVTSEGKEVIRMKYIPGDFEGWADLQPLSTSVGYDDDSEDVIDVEYADEFVNAILHVQESAAADSGAYVSWDSDLSWIIAYASAIMIQTDLLSIILDLTLGNLDEDMADAIKGYLAIANTPEAMRGVLSMFFPILSAVYLDLGYPLRHATEAHLRGAIPYWTRNDSEGNGYMVFEYECEIPTRTADEYPLGSTAIQCPDPELAPGAVVDSEHFAGLDPDEQPSDMKNLGVSVPGSVYADGLESTSPYLAWLDPTINGLLYLNMSQGGCSHDLCSSSIEAADNWKMNYFTIKLIEQGLGFVATAGM